MRRERALTLPRLFAALAACGSVACGLDLGGLAVPGDASSVPGTTSLTDAAVSPVGSGGGSSSGSPGSPGSSPSDAATAPDATIITGSADADAPEASVPPTEDDAGGDGGDECDLDVDGFRSSAGECGGTDCCDRDSRAHPGVTAFFTTPDSCGSFDYNCNGTADPEYAKVNCTIGFLSCSGGGFDQTPPACGVTATFDACNLGIGCYTSQSQQTQGCN